MCEHSYLFVIKTTVTFCCQYIILNIYLLYGTHIGQRGHPSCPTTSTQVPRHPIFVHATGVHGSRMQFSQVGQVSGSLLYRPDGHEHIGSRVGSIQQRSHPGHPFLRVVGTAISHWMWTGQLSSSWSKQFALRSPGQKGQVGQWFLLLRWTGLGHLGSRQKGLGQGWISMGHPGQPGQPRQTKSGSANLTQVWHLGHPLVEWIGRETMQFPGRGAHGVQAAIYNRRIIITKTCKKS